MNNNNPYFLTDESEIVAEIRKIDEQVQEELSKEVVDRERLYQLRFQQLMKGIYLTQNPYEMR